MRVCFLAVVVAAAAIRGSTADLEWNSLTDYLQTFRAELDNEFPPPPPEEEEPMDNPMLRSDSFEGANGRFDVAKLLSRLNKLNITAPETPPLLQMYPGSLDNSTEFANGYGEDVSAKIHSKLHCFFNYVAIFHICKLFLCEISITSLDAMPTKKDGKHRFPVLQKKAYLHRRNYEDFMYD